MEWENLTFELQFDTKNNFRDQNNDFILGPMKNPKKLIFGGLASLSLIIGVSVCTSLLTIQWLDRQSLEEMSEWSEGSEELPPSDPSASSNSELSGEAQQLESKPQVKRRRSRSASSLRDLNEAMVEISERVRPSVVTVFTERVMRVQRNPMFGPFGGGSLFDQFFRDFMGPQPGRPQMPQEEERRQQGLGSGVVISKDGLIMTNNHVIQGADQIKVRLLGGETLEGKVIGGDAQTDIAVIKVEAKDLRPIAIGDSDSLRVGEIVLAVGSPMSANLAHTVTQGIVSAKGRSNVGLADYEDFIQTDAAVNPGNSGGALVNLDGELVGINTAIVSRSGGFQGISFAVPVNMARQVQESLVETGKVIRGWIGVSIQDVTEEIAKAMKLPNSQGVLVAEVTDEGPAEKAGIQAGDVIISFEGDSVRSGTQLRNRIAAMAPGSEVKLKVWREGKELELKARLESLPTELGAPGSAEALPPAVNELLGFQVTELSNSARQQLGLSERVRGVLVQDVEPSSSAAQAGLRPQDVILSINRSRVTNLEEFQAQSSRLKKGQTILLQVARGGGSMFLAFTL